MFDSIEIRKVRNGVIVTLRSDEEDQEYVYDTDRKAIKFIKKSCEFCDSVSFILPKSFKKDSLKKTFPLKLGPFNAKYKSPDLSFLVSVTTDGCVV